MEPFSGSAARWQSAPISKKPSLTRYLRTVPRGGRGDRDDIDAAADQRLGADARIVNRNDFRVPSSRYEVVYPK